MKRITKHILMLGIIAGLVCGCGIDTETSVEGIDKGISAGDIDVDLTVMGSDMIYASVYQMMADPGSYEGKTIRIKGNYYTSYYEPTQRYYHYCIIQDAMACCAQGLEFVWEDGSHIYPDEYPIDDTSIVVTGVFDTYTEEGDSYVYCRLVDATLQVEEDI